MKQSKKKSTFWKKVRFKYKLSFLNENTLEEVFAFRVSRLSAFLVAAVFAFLLIFLTSVVIITTPIRNYLPGYLPAEVRGEIINNALKVDSLEQLLIAQSVYLGNIGGILRGDLKIDSVRKVDSSENGSVPEFDKSKATAEFVERFEEEEKYNLSSLSSSASIPENIVFYRPVNGIVSSHFSVSDKHYGTDIAANPKESILATMKGSAIFAGFDANAGYIIQIQHQNGFVSIYKHCASLLKKPGDEVSAGEVIALVGNTGKLTTGPHLHFELWYRGAPVDPEEFIAF
ncbi:MAG: M23 family metallopeptidase [Dysgonamonadaceae bacterium]|jgi:murein DD-endopeptidase MepM/ murein hydrolase activator NlpD|nr:M23 family metallopeptidase [Dysgonamonadaceae bacterium]